ncbi:MAG: RNA polymerase sigma-54 factor, partial [bacterium]
EVSAVIEEELDRTPLLDRAERPIAGPEAGRSTDALPAAPEPADAASAAASDALPSENAAPLDAERYNL